MTAIEFSGNVVHIYLGEGIREALDAIIAVAVPLVRRRARQATQPTRPVLDSKPVCLIYSEVTAVYIC